MKFRFILFLTLFLYFIQASALFSQSWSNTGPYGARITELITDMTDTNLIYAGTYGAGIYKSIDGGRQWAEVNEGLPVRDNSFIGSLTGPSWWFGDFYPVNDLDLNAQESSRIFAGTNGGGISKSINAANVWFESNQGLPDNAGVSVIWQHPEDTSIVYCGTGGLYVSRDGGLNWNLVEGVPSGATYRVTSIKAQPNDPNTIYVGITSAGEPELPWGLLKTSDGGQSWEVLSQRFSFYDLQIDPSDSTKIWSAIYTGFMQWHLAYSEDGGITWNIHPDFSELSLLRLFADSNWKLYVLATASGVKVIGKSEDAGETWNFRTVSLNSLSVIAVNSLLPETIFLGTNEGVYRSNDGGDTFELKSDGMINTYMNEIKVNPANSSIIYAGGDQGLWRSMDDGNRWVKIHGGQVNSIAIDPDHPDTVYWGNSGGLYRSFDGGDNSVKIREGIITALAIHPDSTNVLYAGVYASNLYRSENYGETWSLSFSASIGISFWIEDIEISRSNSSKIYFGAIRNAVFHGLYKSSNSGASWVKISDPGEVLSISTHPTNDSIIYFATRFGVFRSINGGISYSEISGDLTAQQYSTVWVNPKEPSQILIGTKDQGVFVSSDDGGTWNWIEGGYNPRIMDINYSGDLNRIFLATHGGGIWKGNDIEVGVESREQMHIPENVHLFNAYPNPFNPVTNIRYSLTERSDVTLLIYNIIGEEIRKFSETGMQPGYHEFVWDASDAASGVYLYRFQAGDYVETRKMILLK